MTGEGPRSKSDSFTPSSELLHAYITGLGSNRKAESQAMGRSASYIQSAVDKNSIVGLQETVTIFLDISTIIV